jgi:hypothetical protein
MAITVGKIRDSHGHPRYTGACKVAASTALVTGAICSVVSGAGYLINGATAITHLVQGIVRKDVDNSTGSAGDKTAEFEYGVIAFTNSADADAIAQADFGKPVFLVDNDVAAKTSGNGTRSILGICMGMLGTKVLVMIGPDVSASLDAIRRLGSLANVQIATGAVVNGVLTVATGIVVTASTYVLPVPLAAITGSTNVGPLAHIKASDIAGAAGTGSVTVNVLGANGATDTDAACASVLLVIIN